MKSRTWLRGAVCGAVGVAAACILAMGGSTLAGAGSLPLTSLSLTSSLNPSVYGTPVTFTASVGILPLKITTGLINNGEVAFYDGATLLGVRPLNSSDCRAFIGIDQCKARLTTSSLGAGNNVITAVYAGDLLLSSDKTTFTQHTVDEATTTAIRLASSCQETKGNDPYTVTVTGASGVSPRGTLSLTIDSTTDPSLDQFISGLPLTPGPGGTATFSNAYMIPNPGTYKVGATYVPTSGFTASSAAPHEILVAAKC